MTIQPPITHIWFYSTRTPYRQFSNFYVSPFVLNNKSYKTVEHYFQSQKFIGTDHEEILRNAVTATDVKRLGRQRKRPLRPDWESCKENIMYTAVEAKILQNSEIKDLLLSTEDKILCEHTNKDKEWADGNDPCWAPQSTYGKNKLGIILMKLRDQLYQVQ